MQYLLHSSYLIQILANCLISVVLSFVNFKSTMLDYNSIVNGAVHCFLLKRTSYCLLVSSTVWMPDASKNIAKDTHLHGSAAIPSFIICISFHIRYTKEIYCLRDHLISIQQILMNIFCPKSWPECCYNNWNRNTKK